MGNLCDCKCSERNSEHEQTEPSKQPELTPVEFASLKNTLKTGDLCVLYRKGMEETHYAMFVVYEDLCDHAPLLLLKGKTKPLPLDHFKLQHGNNLRHVRLVSANCRIFYNDYVKVLIYKLKRDQVIPGERVDEVTEIVRKLKYHKDELKVIEDTKISDARRSQYVCTFMLAHVMSRLGCMNVTPHNVMPEDFMSHLNLGEPTSIILPEATKGPRSPPFFAKLINGIMAPSHIKTVKFDDIVHTLNTGDLVLFSGATTSGALIKLFDNAEFSHIGIVIARQTCTNAPPLVWEASTNRGGLVDIETGKVTQGVELLPLKHKVFSGWYNRVAVRQLIVDDKNKRVEMMQHLFKFKEELGERPYEKNKLQLIRSALDFHQDYFTFLKNEQEDLSSLFCSELVAAAYQRMGLLEFDKTSDNYKTSNEYTPDDFTSRRDDKLRLQNARLEKEIYIEMKHH